MLKDSTNHEARFFWTANALGGRVWGGPIAGNDDSNHVKLTPTTRTKMCLKETASAAHFVDRACRSVATLVLAFWHLSLPFCALIHGRLGY
jgi:hypothetical protein